MQHDRMVRKQLVNEYLSNHPCVDCGNDDIRVLEFDHIQPKEMTIAYAIGHVGVERLFKEIEKCEVRCANCHSIRHYKERADD